MNSRLVRQSVHTTSGLNVKVKVTRSYSNFTLVPFRGTRWTLFLFLTRRLRVKQFQPHVIHGTFTGSSNWIWPPVPSIMIIEICRNLSALSSSAAFVPNPTGKRSGFASINYVICIYHTLIRGRISVQNIPTYAQGQKGYVKGFFYSQCGLFQVDEGRTSEMNYVTWWIYGYLKGVLAILIKAALALLQRPFPHCHHHRSAHIEYNRLSLVSTVVLTVFHTGGSFVAIIDISNKDLLTNVATQVPGPTSCRTIDWQTASTALVAQTEHQRRWIFDVIFPECSQSTPFA